MSQKGDAALNVEDKPILIRELIPKAERKIQMEKKYRQHNLVIQGLPETMTSDAELKAFFEQFGPVNNARVYVSDTGMKDAEGNAIKKCKGYGFVCFEKQIHALTV